MTKKAWLFILLAFALTWGLWFSYFSLGGNIASPLFTVVGVAGMATPAVAAIVVQRLVYGKPLTAMGLRLTFNAWYAVAWLFPFVLIGGTILASLLVPGVHLTSGEENFLVQLEKQISPEAARAAVQQIEQTGLSFAAFTVLTGTLGALLAGPTVNAAVALGEELGWRGLLQQELAPLGFWRASAGVGVVWGLWHLPLVLQGYNYPEHPVAGVFMMVGFTVLLSPLFAFVRYKAGSVLAAAVFHGMINALAGFTVFLSGGSDLTGGPTGAAGFAVLILVNGGVLLYQYRHDRTALPTPLQRS